MIPGVTEQISCFERLLAETLMPAIADPAVAEIARRMAADLRKLATCASLEADFDSWESAALADLAARHGVQTGVGARQALADRISSSTSGDDLSSLALDLVGFGLRRQQLSPMNVRVDETSRPILVAEYAATTGGRT